MPDDKKIGYLNAANVYAGTSFDKQRIEDGMSSEIIEIHSLSVDMSKLYDQIKRSNGIEDTASTLETQPIDIPVCPEKP